MSSVRKPPSPAQPANVVSIDRHNEILPPSPGAAKSTSTGGTQALEDSVFASWCQGDTEHAAARKHGVGSRWVSEVVHSRVRPLDPVKLNRFYEQYKRAA